VEDLREHKKRSAAPCCLTPRPVQPSAVLHLSSTLRAGFAGAAAFAAPSLTAAAAALRRRADQDQGMALPAEQRDVAIELHNHDPVAITNLLNLTHANAARRVERVMQRAD
jgi:hypothetical protein